VRLFVKHAPLGGKPVLAPQPLDVNQGALPLAEQQVLKAGKGQEIGFGVRHGGLTDCPRFRGSGFPYVRLLNFDPKSKVGGRTNFPTFLIFPGVLFGDLRVDGQTPQVFSGASFNRKSESHFVVLKSGLLHGTNAGRPGNPGQHRREAMQNWMTSGHSRWHCGGSTVGRASVRAVADGQRRFNNEDSGASAVIPQLFLATPVG
jgi:hypothetical protein